MAQKAHLEQQAKTLGRM